MEKPQPAVLKLSERAWRRISALDDYDFLRLCYNAILDREPDPEGFDAQFRALEAGHPRQAIIESMLASLELAARDPQGSSHGYRMAFFDAGGYLDPTLRNLLNQAATRVKRESIVF